MHGKSNMETYIAMRKVDSQWEFFVSGTRHCGFWLLISTGAPRINLPGILRDNCTFTSPLCQEVVLIHSRCLGFLSHTANSRRLSILHVVM